MTLTPHEVLAMWRAGLTPAEISRRERDLTPDDVAECLSNLGVPVEEREPAPVGGPKA